MFFKFIFKKKKEEKLKQKITNKFDINSWMKLTKEERIEIDFKEKDKSMRKKKELLKSIRDEYIKIKEKNN